MFVSTTLNDQWYPTVYFSKIFGYARIWNEFSIFFYRHVVLLGLIEINFKIGYWLLGIISFLLPYSIFVILLFY